MLSGLLIALFGSVASAMIVASALPTLARELVVSPSEATLVVTVSLLGMTVAVPVWGRAADHFDLKRVLQIVMLVFIGGSLAAGLAPSFEGVVAARAVQGVSTGGVLVLAQTVTAKVTTSSRRGAYTGYLGAVMSLASLCGPVLGGLIVDAPGLGWRWCFLLLVPLALVSLVVLSAALPRRPERRAPFRADVGGVVVLLVTTAALLSWLALAGSAFPWLSLPSVLLLALIALGAVGLVIVERHAVAPVVDLGALSLAAVRWSVVASIALGAVMFASVLNLSQYWQLGRGASAAEAGLLLAPMLAGTLVASIAAGYASVRARGLRAVLVAGSLTLVVGLGLLGLLGPTTAGWFVLAASGLAGVGMGALMQNLVLVAQRAAPALSVGRVTSLVSLSRSVSGVIGVSVFSTAAVAGAAVPPAAIVAASTGTVFIAMAVLALGAVLAVALIVRRELPPPG